MNFLDPIAPQGREAKLRFLDADFEILREGDFVRCGVTGDPIRLEHLQYWSVSRQQAFQSPHVAFAEFLKMRR